jgi:DNA-binding PadR family transcriptional regulator
LPVGIGFRKTETMKDPADREIRLAFWKLHVLHHAAQGPIYGLWMLQELAQHGHRISPGTLYPILARMEANGWLRSSLAGAGVRRSYRITPAGRRILARLRRELAELHRELVLGEGPDVSQRPAKAKHAPARPR